MPMASVWAVCVTSSQRAQNGKGELESNLMVEKPDKYHLSQVSKPMSTVKMPIDGMYT